MRVLRAVTEMFEVLIGTLRMLVLGLLIAAVAVGTAIAGLWALVSW